MAKANTAPVYNKYGYYFISVTMGDKKFDIATRGYKVQSWVDFETSLNLPCTVNEITKEQYDTQRFGGTDVEVDPIKKTKKRK